MAERRALQRAHVEQLTEHASTQMNDAKARTEHGPVRQHRVRVRSLLQLTSMIDSVRGGEKVIARNEDIVQGHPAVIDGVEADLGTDVARRNAERSEGRSRFSAADVASNVAATASSC